MKYNYVAIYKDKERKMWKKEKVISYNKIKKFLNINDIPKKHASKIYEKRWIKYKGRYYNLSDFVIFDTSESWSGYMYITESLVITIKIIDCESYMLGKVVL